MSARPIGPRSAAALGSGTAFLLYPTALSAHPPVGPGEFWSAWNWDPWILLLLGIAVTTYLTGVRRLWRRAGRGRGIPRWRAGAYLLGVWTLYAALVSPLHALGHSLFSLHMLQHMLLMVVAAPLLVLGHPGTAFVWAFSTRWRLRLGMLLRAPPLSTGWKFVAHPASVLLLHVGALWVWHLPALYEAALSHHWVHTIEHASFLLTAILFWWVLASHDGYRRWSGYGAAILYVFATALQSGALGALITFAPRRWYVGHEVGATLWGTDALADQQLAGVLMWVPAGLVYAAAASALLVLLLRSTGQEMRRRERAVERGWSPRRWDPTFDPRA